MVLSIPIFSQGRYPIAVTPVIEESEGPSLPASCIADYGMEGVVTDAMGNYDGTLIGDATYDTDSFFCGANSIILDGTNDALDCGAVNVTTTFSIELAFNLSELGYQTVLCSNRNGNDLENGFTLYAELNESLKFKTGDGASGFDYISTATGLFNWDEWNHVVITVERNNEIFFYLNGVDVTPTPNDLDNTIFAVSGQEFDIGSHNNNTYEGNGYFDNVRIYNSVLSSEVSIGLYTNKCLY